MRISKRKNRRRLPSRLWLALGLSLPLFAALLPSPRIASVTRAEKDSSITPLPIRSLGNLSDPSNRALRASLVELPLGFEQGISANEFVTRGDGYDVRLQASRIHLASTKRDRSARRAATTSIKLVRASVNATGTAQELLPGKTNYLIGHDRSHWRTGVNRFAKVRYEEIYPLIDLVYYGKQRQLEYDFIVSPGGNPNQIRLGFARDAKLSISKDGELIADTAAGQFRQPPPIVFQEIGGSRVSIGARYVLKARREIGFALAEYDHSQPLVIDPTLVYSTYLGGSGDDVGSSIGVDIHNNIYVTGTTSSANFPTKNAFASNAGLSDIFVTRIDPAGGALVYSTYIGGSGLDRADGIAVDYNGSAYIAGRVDSSSTNFPTTPGAFATTYRGGDFDAVVFKLGATGNLIYSTFLGGEENDSAVGVVIDLSRNAYVTGGTRSTGFPTTASAYQPTKSGDTDGFLTKLSASGSTLLYSTFIGGGGTDRISGVALADPGLAYIDGYTASNDFPTQNAFQNSFGGGFDAFVAEIDTNANGAASLLFCSYLGGAGDDKAYGIENAGGSLYLAGQTSSANFPVLNAAQAVSGGNFDAFVARISNNGAKVFATYLGGSGDDRATGIAVNSAGEAYVNGFTASPNFPTANPLQPTYGGGIDAFLAKLNAAGNSFLYSTYLGGSAAENSASTVTATKPIKLDSAGNVLMTGYSASANFPTAAPLQANNAGGQDVFIARISDAAPASLQFSANTISANENDGSVKISVTRSGNTATAVDVDHATSDGSASGRTDYTTTAGTLHFAAGETSKEIAVPLVDDVYVEESKTIILKLVNPQGGGAFLGSPTSATLTITDNDVSAPAINPLDSAPFFVRQHYLDFLNREPDSGGLSYWTNEITKCGSDITCTNGRRIDVSAAFFASEEFQDSGGLIYRIYRGTLGRDPTYAEFIADRSKLVGGPDLANKQHAFVFDFTGRPEFQSKYPEGSSFIATLAQTARSASGAPLPNLESELAQLYDQCNLSIPVEAFCQSSLIEYLADKPEFASALYNRSFVLMEYFGYLRRDPDAGGYAFWLDVLNNREPNNYRGMVCSFITSAEYQMRLSPVVTRTNSDCGGIH